MDESRELSLVDVYQVFRRNWLIALGLIVVCTVISSAYTLSKPKLYSYQGLIEISSITDPNAVGAASVSGPQGNSSSTGRREVDADEVATLLKFEFSGKSVAGSGASLSEVQIQDNGRTALNPYYESSLISISTMGPSVDAAKSEINAVVTGLRSALQPKLSQFSQDARDQLKDIDEQLASVRSILQEIDRSSKASRDPGLLIALSIKRESYQNQMTQLLRERRRVSRMVFDANQSIRLLSQGPVSMAPVSPKIGKGLTLGALLGCVLAFVLVLALEARRKSQGT
jgi:uncharacterized protein involved in exopolysaccharide biosynthesis